MTEKNWDDVDATDGAKTPETKPQDVPMGDRAPVPLVDGQLMPGNFEGLYRMAAMLFKSGFCPPGLNSVESVFAAVVFGGEIGLKPMQSIQNVAVINNRPSVWGDAVLGLVRASGDLTDIDEYFEKTSTDGGHVRMTRDPNIKEMTDENLDVTAVCTTKRKGSTKAITRRFSVSDATQAGLWCQGTKEQKKMYGPWYKYPRRMLQMRARSFNLRDTFGDVLKGLTLREEAEDYIDITPEKITGPEIEDAGEPNVSKLTPEEEKVLDEKEKTTEEPTEDPPEADPPPDFKPCSPRVYNPIKDLLKFLEYDEQAELKRRTIDNSGYWNKLSGPKGEAWLVILETERDTKIEVEQAGSAEPEKEKETTEFIASITTDPDSIPGEWSPPGNMEGMVPDLYMAISGFEEALKVQFTQAQVNTLCAKFDSPDHARDIAENQPEVFEAMVKDVIS